jgi:hypothetical protein
MQLRHLYLALCIPGALWPGYHLVAGVDGAVMLHDMFASHSVSLIVADLLWCALVGVLWMTLEARRLAMRWPVYLGCALVLPFSIVLPFFLYRREVVMGTLRDR